MGQKLANMTGFNHQLISIDQQPAWDKAIALVPHTYAHTHWYNQAMQLASKRDIFLYLGEENEFRVICPISTRKKNADDSYDITTPYGFSGFASVGSSVNFIHEWHAYMRANHFVCGHIALHPFLQKDFLYEPA